VGDIVLEVAGARPKSLADLWRRVWALGASGAVVPLKLGRNGKTSEVRIASADRNDFLKKPHLH
jgi:S1-C subfamily serine protease